MGKNSEKIFAWEFFSNHLDILWRKNVVHFSFFKTQKTKLKIYNVLEIFSNTKAVQIPANRLHLEKAKLPDIRFRLISS